MNNDNMTIMDLVNANADKAAGRVVFTAEDAIKYYSGRQGKGLGTPDNNSAAQRTYKNTLTNSIGGGPTKVSGRRPTTKFIDTTKFTNRVALTVCALTMVVAIGISSALVIGPKIEERDNMREATRILTGQASQTLVNYGLAGIDENEGIIVGNNSVSAYRQLNISSQLEVYVYSLVLPDEELNKCIKATPIKAEDRNILYTDIEQFLRINGYVDKQTGEPSWQVFGNYMEAEIKKIYKDVIENYKIADANNDGTLIGEERLNFQNSLSGNKKGGK